MAELIAIVGPSGSGKSTSLKGLNPEESAIISVTGKALPFRGWKKMYTPFSSDGTTGNYFKTDNAELMIGVMKGISNSRPEIKNIVIDDYNYGATFELFQRSKESGYGKFTDMANSIAKPVIEGTKLRGDLKIFILNHDETIMEDTKPLRKIKTIGKMVDNSLVMEGLFTVVLFTDVRKDENGKIVHSFVTQNDGSTTAKSPDGMFETELIPNDLGIVVKAIDYYYEG